MTMTLGIDVACRASHQASLAIDGRLAWTGRKFFTRTSDLEALWADLDLEDPGGLTVVLEPTRNAWIVLASWFRARGALVVMVPTVQCEGELPEPAQDRPDHPAAGPVPSGPASYFYAAADRCPGRGKEPSRRRRRPVPFRPGRGSP